jgi:hypothetical protein
MKNPDCIDYALGELHGERREAFEHELADSTELQQELKETIALIGTLRKVSKSTDGLEVAQRERLLAACRKNIVAKKQRSNIIRLVIPLSLAALALIALLLDDIIPARSYPRELSNTSAIQDSTQTESLRPTIARKSISNNWSVTTTTSITTKDALLNLSPLVMSETWMGMEACELASNESRDHGLNHFMRTPRHTRDTEENPFISPSKTSQTFMPLSTTADSYAQVRKAIRSGKLPDPSTIRSDELVNAFTYSFERASIQGPFAIDLEAGKAPWNPNRFLVKVGIQVRNPTEDSSLLLNSLMVSLNFDPKLVAGYRLIGYEKHGQPANSVKSLSKPSIPLTLMAIYEINPVAGLRAAPSKTPLFNLLIHHKFPNDTDCLHVSMQYPVDSIPADGQNSTDFRFVSAVIAFGMKLAQNSDANSMSWSKIQQLAANNLGPDTDGQRADFVDLIHRASRVPIS